MLWSDKYPIGSYKMFKKQWKQRLAVSLLQRLAVSLLPDALQQMYYSRQSVIVLSQDS